ncbi:Yip1 family protein [Heliophilum fasciatum]|uniref:Yip1-like protein n=1 Tax=Heliophilum fasciatum TaxID=35700 RepID=A0A4R2RRT9_9FIRM|nr:Yip1 family protein [Heliophilum fasciatum]MCW2277502.1 hypothetical protein [Heliophilum fasciatum]TCP65207.1 Yip1-like protein [Heliophilum fasciatum]
MEEKQPWPEASGPGTADEKGPLPAADGGVAEPVMTTNNWPWSDYLYYVLVAPVRALRQAARQKPLGLAVAVVLTIAMIALAAQILLGPPEAGFMGRPMNSSTWRALVTLAGTGAIIIGLGGWIMAAAFFNLAGELLRGRPNAKGLLTALGLAQLPNLFQIPLQAIDATVGLPQGVESLLVTVLSLWVALLQIIAVREALALSTGRALLIVCVPLLLIGAITVAAVIAAVTFIHAVPGLSTL